MGVRAWLRDWLNAGFDPATTDPQLLRRARSVSVGVAAILLLGPPFIVQYLNAGAYGLAAVVVVSWLISAASVVVLRREQRVAAAGAIALTSTTLVCLAVITASGGFYDETFASLYMLPVAAFGWLGRRNGALWSVALVGITVLFWSLETYGPGTSQLWGVEASLALRDGAFVGLVNRLGTLFGVAVLAATLVGTHERSEARLLDDRHTLAAAVERSRAAEGQAVREAEARARFAATLSHELRTPMTAAMASADLLMETELDPNQRELTMAIVRSGQTMLGIVEDVLDYSKLQAGAQPLDVRDFSPRELLEGIGQMLAPQAHTKKLELVLDLDDHLPAKLRGDGGRLRQILLNLVSNALKFTQQGEIVLGARFEAGVLHARVRDSGIGMTPEELTFVFDPFARAPNSAARAGGTGLGLTIAKHFTQHMGGGLRASSTPGEGCCFEIELPLEEVAGAEAVVPVELGGGALVVDDHRQSAGALQSLLGSLGVASEVAYDETSALAALARGNFDRVLVDERLPDGAAARLLTAAGPDRGILLRSPGTRRNETQQPGTVELAKPVGRSNLREALTTHTDDTRSSERPLASSGVMGTGAEADGAMPEAAPHEAPATTYAQVFLQLRRYVPTEQDTQITRQLLDGFLERASLRTKRLSELVSSSQTERMQGEARALRRNLGAMGLTPECQHCTELTTLSLPRDRARAGWCLGQIERCLASISASQGRFTTESPVDGSGARAS